MKEVNLIKLFKSIWSKRKSIALWGAVAMVVGLVVAYSSPNEYISSIKVVSESKSGQSASSSVGALAGMMGMNFGASNKSGITAEMYPQVVSSTPFLNDLSSICVPFDRGSITLQTYLTQEQKAPWWSSLLALPGRFLGWIRGAGGQDAASADQADMRQFKTNKPTHLQITFENTLKSRIKFSEDKKTNIITVEIKMQDPAVATVVADSVVSRLQYYMAQYHTSKARHELQMNESLLKQARQKYYTIDSSYALAMDRNQNLISKSAQIKLDRLQTDRSIASSVYQQLSSQVEMSKIKVQEDTPIVTVLEPAREPLVPDSPKKKVIVLAMFFVGAFLRVLTLVIRVMYESTSTDIEPAN